MDKIMNMLDEAKKLNPKLRTWRRDFHMHPELGFQEIRTSKKIGDYLDEMGYRVRREVGRTGVVGEIGQGSPCIAIRADMDALPLQELNPVDYASQTPGIMHACGHDVHMTCALGAAFLLSRLEFQGAVRFLFQPSEEVADREGFSGAQRMLADGALEGVDAILALHVESCTPTGAIRTKIGPASGGVDSWFGTIVGKGGHGAYPHETIDPFFLLAQVINAINGIVSRRVYPFHPAVISIGSVQGGHAENVIPERVSITGTLRFTEKRVQELLHNEIRKAFELTRVLGGDYDLRIEIGSPPMVNHPAITEIVAGVGRDLLGVSNVLPWREELGAEDFGCFMERVPGTMFTLGTHASGPELGLHSPQFDVDEDCLPVGTAILTESVLRYLRTEEFQNTR